MNTSLAVLFVGLLGLAGCASVPPYGQSYGYYGNPHYYSSGPFVVRPYYGGDTGFYHPHHHHHHHKHRPHHDHRD